MHILLGSLSTLLVASAGLLPSLPTDGLLDTGAVTGAVGSTVGGLVGGTDTGALTSGVGKTLGGVLEKLPGGAAGLLGISAAEQCDKSCGLEVLTVGLLKPGHSAVTLDLLNGCAKASCPQGQVVETYAKNGTKLSEEDQLKCSGGLWLVGLDGHRKEDWGGASCVKKEKKVIGPADCALCDQDISNTKLCENNENCKTIQLEKQGECAVAKCPKGYIARMYDPETKKAVRTSTGLACNSAKKWETSDPKESEAKYTTACVPYDEKCESCEQKLFKPEYCGIMQTCVTPEYGNKPGCLTATCPEGYKLQMYNKKGKQLQQTNSIACDIKGVWFPTSGSLVKDDFYANCAKDIKSKCKAPTFAKGDEKEIPTDLEFDVSERVIEEDGKVKVECSDTFGYWKKGTTKFVKKEDLTMECINKRWVIRDGDKSSPYDSTVIVGCYKKV